MSGSIYNDEVLDLREMILILWRRKWLIVGIPLLVGMLTLLISSTLVPKRYQATSYVTITDPKTRGEIEPYGFPEIAESVELIQMIFSELDINNLAEQDTYEFSSSIKSRGQIQLTVTFDEPVLAAEVANIWGDVLANRLNDIYGMTEENLKVLEEETADAEGNWIAAQIELEKFLDESGLLIYPVEISAAQATLEDTLREIDLNILLLSDIQTLAEQIKSLDPSNPLPSGIELNLINLQARVTAVQREIPPEIKIDTQSYNSGDVISHLEDLEAALHSQNQILAEEVISLKAKITELNMSLVEENYQESQLKLVRDQAQSTYIVLASNLEEGNIHQIQELFNIKISAKAIPPSEAIRTNLLIKVVFASVSAGLLTILGSFFHAWWVGREDA